MATRLLIAGDTHGHILHCRYLASTAKANNSWHVYQLGDFGYWEHEGDGVWFLDDLSRYLVKLGVVWFWIDGNHENHTLLRQRYVDSPKSPEGFWAIRPNIFYIPRGTEWTVDNVRFLGLGGAYSTDMPRRIKDEHTVCAEQGSHNWCEAETRWWPDEQITDDEAQQAASGSPIDIMLTHDKPRNTNPQLPFKDNAECWPNQDRISRVVRARQPKLLLHGHLHHPYRDHIRVSGEDWCEVIGLDADPQAGLGRTSEGRPRYNREDSWAVLELSNGQFQMAVTPPSLR